MEAVSRVVDLVVQRRDPRFRDSFMQSSPVPMGLIMLAYLALVGYGPRFMKNRKTPPLRLVMTVYNVGQVLLSAYMMREFWLSRPATQFCSRIDVSTDEKTVRLANACWLFHISKLVDFLDTVFLVLKKDNKRLTYLHVYHHGSMAFGFWLCPLYAPGGSTWIGGVINSFVHCIMYSYYLLASMGPTMQPYLWWKRYLTQLQLTQFAIIVAISVAIQTPWMRCGMPFWTCSMALVYMVVITALFINFYVRAYLAGSRAPKPPAPAAPVAVPKPAPPKETPVPPAETIPATREPSSYSEPSTLRMLGRTLMRNGFGCFINED